MSNHLPIRATKREETGSWEFEWDEDALIYQAQVGCCLMNTCSMVESFFSPKSPNTVLPFSMQQAYMGLHVGPACSLIWYRLAMASAWVSTVALHHTFCLHATESRCVQWPSLSWPSCAWCRMASRTWRSCLWAAFQLSWIQTSRM